MLIVRVWVGGGSVREGGGYCGYCEYCFWISVDTLGECASVDRQSVSRRRISTRGRRITKGRESWRLAVSERERGRDHHGRGDRGRCEEELVGSHRRWEGVQALVRVGCFRDLDLSIIKSCTKVGHSRGLPAQHPHPDRSVPILTSSSDGRPYMGPLKSRSCVGNFRNCGQSAHFSRHILLQTRSMKTNSLQNAGRTISQSLHVPKHCTNNYKQIKYDNSAPAFYCFIQTHFWCQTQGWPREGYELMLWESTTLFCCLY